MLEIRLISIFLQESSLGRKQTIKYMKYTGTRTL